MRTYSPIPLRLSLLLLSSCTGCWCFRRCFLMPSFSIFRPCCCVSLHRFSVDWSRTVDTAAGLQLGSHILSGAVPAYPLPSCLLLSMLPKSVA